MEDALEAFLGTGAGPVRLATARHIARETLEAWRSGRISTAQALRTFAEARDLVGRFVGPATVRRSDAAPAAGRPPTRPSSGNTPTDRTAAGSPTRGTNEAGPAVRNDDKAMGELRCTCGAIHDHLLPAGVQEIDDREYLELGTCPACGTTLCVRQWTLSSSAKWRASIPPSRESRPSSSIPAASVVPPVE